MQKSRLNTIRVLCFSAFLGILGACNLQGKDPGFYRLTASGSGLIEIEVGFGMYITGASSPWYRLDYVVWRDSYQGEGNWHMDLEEEEVKKQATSDCSNFLCVQVRGPGEVSAGAFHFVDGPLVDEETGCGSYGIATTGVCAWSKDGDSGAGGYGGGSNPYANPAVFGHATVICSELHRQGLMDEAVYYADEAFGEYLRDNHKDVLIGYHLWAKPVVSLMQKSRVFTRIVNVLAAPWSYEMARIMGENDQGSVVGKIVMFVGVPVCRAIGRVVLWAGSMVPQGTTRALANASPL